MQDEQYLGDCVYLRFDGYHYVLVTEGNEIFLERTVWEALARNVTKRWPLKVLDNDK